MSRPRALRPSRPNLVLAVLYLLVAMPLAVRVALVTVPFDMPDEFNHFFRATQIGQGGLVSRSFPGGNAGGALPTAAVEIVGLDHLVHGPGHDRITVDALAPYRAIRWHRGRELIGFVNTAVYGPFLYTPAALAIDLGRVTGMTVIATLRLARLADAVTATALSTLAILIADAGLPLLPPLLLLPMTLSLFASASQDGLLIAGSALAASVLTRRAAGRPAGWLSWILLGLLLGIIATGRLPYVLFAALPVVVSWNGPARRRGVVAAVLAVVVAGGWFLIGVERLGVSTRAGGSLLGGTEMHWLLRHGSEGLLILWRTLLNWPAEQFREMVGVLGWLDILLPPRVYQLTEYALVGALAMTLAGRPDALLTRALVAATILATVLLIYLAMFLSWTRPGAATIEGLQGRYFIPVALFGCLLGRPGIGIGRTAATALFVVWLALVETVVVIPRIAAHLIG